MQSVNLCLFVRFACDISALPQASGFSPTAAALFCGGLDFVLRGVVSLNTGVRFEKSKHLWGCVSVPLCMVA